MSSENFIDKKEFPKNRPYYLNQGRINLPKDFVKWISFKDCFSNDKLSKLLASFPSVDVYTQFLLDAKLSYREIEKYEALNGKNDKSNLEVANRKIRLAKYRLYCFCYCNSLRKAFLNYKKFVEDLIKSGSNAENIEEMVKFENKIYEYNKIGKSKFLTYDNLDNLEPKYYEAFSENYQFLLGSIEEYLSSLNKVKWDTVDFCTKIYEYALVYKEIKDVYLYFQYLDNHTKDICQLLINLFCWNNKVKGLLK